MTISTTPRRVASASQTLTFTLLVLGGCVGNVGRTDDPATDGEPSGTGGTSVGGGFIGPTSGGGAGGGSPVSVVPGPTALRRLTNDEYRNTIRDLLGLSAPLTDALQKETRSNGFDNFSSVLTVSTTLANQYEEIAARLANQADVGKLAPCASGTTEAACATRFVKNFGKRAFRRPLTDAEESAYQGIYDVGRKGGTHADGIKAVLEAMLASPKLLYRFELGTPSGGSKRVLGPYEVASELSYLITGTLPDEELLAAADANRLATPAQVEAHARRLLKSPSAKTAIRKLVTQWFGIANLEQVSKDTSVYPLFTPELRAAMGAESERFVDAVLWERDGTLTTLLSSPATFVDGALAKVYGVSAPAGNTLAARDLDPQQRAGLLTHASVMSVYSHPGDSFPIARGKFIRKNLLCHALPPPPPGEVITPPPPKPNQTTRERFAQHSTNPTCAACHELIDPLGFGLENYDGIGVYRTMENGKPVDAAGHLSGTPDADGPYTGGVELANKLASSRTTAECAAIQATRWAYGRKESESDEAVATSIATLLGGGKMDLRELIVTLTKTESFYVRTAEP